MPSSQKHGSITTRSVFEKERHAEERRRQQMEARRERLREHMTHVKTVALEHATRMKDEVTRLGMEIARKQAEAAARRKALFEEGRRRSSQRTAIVPSTTVESSLLVTHGKKVSETEEIKSLKAKWRACQRLVCVVAKSRLHNAKAKQLALRARSAKIIQRRWRSTLERIRMVREMFFNKENIAALEFWRSSDSMLGNKASFEDVMAFMNDARSVRAVDVLLLSVRNKEHQKLVLMCHMLVRHPQEILSLMERKRSILVFTSKRLLRITWLLSDQLLVLASEKNPVLPLLEQLQQFHVALEAFSVLFRSMKEEDAEALAEDMFDGIVSIRVQLEELRDRGSSDGADRIQFLEKFFFESIGKVKRLLHRQQHPDKYKRFLERVSREVRRRRDDLNLVRRVAAQPDTAKLPSSKPREGNQMTLEKFSDLSNSEFVIVVVNGLNDIKRRLKEITPNRVDPDLDAGVDVKLIRQQLEHGAFDFPRDFIVLARFIGGKICFLSEPDRAEALTRWMDETFTTGEGDGRPWKVRKLVFSTFERLFQSLSEIEHDVANFHLQALKTVINTTTSPEGESIVQAHVRGSNVGRVPALLRWIGPSVDDTDVDPLALFPKILAQNLVDHHEFIPAAEDAFDSFEAKQLAEIHSLAIRTLRVAYNQLIWRQVVVGGEGKFSVKAVLCFEISRVLYNAFSFLATL